MDFWNYTPLRDACKRAGTELPCNDLEEFYRLLFTDAMAMRSGQFLGQAMNERAWERARITTSGRRSCPC